MTRRLWIRNLCLMFCIFKMRMTSALFLISVRIFCSSNIFSNVFKFVFPHNFAGISPPIFVHFNIPFAIVNEYASVPNILICGLRWANAWLTVFLANKMRHMLSRLAPAFQPPWSGHSQRWKFKRVTTSPNRRYTSARLSCRLKKNNKKNILSCCFFVWRWNP